MVRIIEAKEGDMIQPNPQTSPAALLPAVIDIVRKAGELIRKEFHRPGGPRGHAGKAPVDETVERFLREELQRLHTCGWLGEETGEEECYSGDVWVVDPNDGTSDFLRGMRGSAISVALLRVNQPVLGVVFAPVAPDDDGDLFAWAQGAGLTRNGEPVTHSLRHDRPVVALNADAADYALHNHRALPGIRVRAIPSPAYRLALAAAREVDAGISLVWGLEPWDFAGGHALLLGAGRVLVDIHGRDVDYKHGAIDGCVGGEAGIVARIVASDLRHGERHRRKPARPHKPFRGGKTLSRAQGCQLGQLAGDALGSAVEFKHGSWIAERFPDGVRDLIDGGSWSTIAGQPTDDSELALALARAIALKGGFDTEATKRAYIEWLASGPFDVGTTTRGAIEALEMGWAVRAESQSNGALMRVSPIGIYAAGDPALAARLAAEDARLTHPHPVCAAANAAYAAAIAAGIGGADAEGMWEAAHAHAGTDAAAKIVRARLDASRTAPPAEFYDQMGWVLTAFQNAFFWLMNGAPLEDALIATVSSGGDTDTNGAICGALLGALQGRRAVPLRWRNAIMSCRPVRADDVVQPRPMTYWPDDALELAEALVAAGASRNPRGTQTAHED